MMKICRLFFSAILISFIPIGGNHQEARIDRVTAEEYAVYSALLNEIKVSPQDGKEVKLLVINDQTEGPDKRCFPEEIARWDDRIRANELKRLLENLMEKNRSSKSLHMKFGVNKKYVLLKSQNYSSIFENIALDGWTDFYKKYPASSGYITFSRVGFNSDGTKAVIYREVSCGGLCGYGGYILLSKDNGAWIEINSYGCWES
jgi:hypothetical protein